MHIIVKPTRREAESQRREALAKQGLSPQRFRGTARTAEEAHDLQRELEKSGETFKKVWAIADDSPDAKQANQDKDLKMGVNPETKESLFSKSTDHR